MRYLGLSFEGKETRYDGYHRIPFDVRESYDFPTMQRGKLIYTIDGFQVYNDQGEVIGTGRLLSKMMVCRGVTPRLSYIEYHHDDTSPCPCCGRGP